jgi:hypothetical protein
LEIFYEWMPGDIVNSFGKQIRPIAVKGMLPASAIKASWQSSVHIIFD